MKIIYNTIIPIKGFIAINLFGVIFARKGSAISNKTINHEAIHTAQMKEMLYVFFYLWYMLEWFLKLFKYGKLAYYNISFEREAYNNDDNSQYLTNRKRFQWFWMI